MSELDDFLTTTLDRQVEAEQALVSGDPMLRLAMTSTQDPVTVFGAKVPFKSGWDEVSETLRWLAGKWSDSTDYRFDVVAADVSGDLAYLVGFEHIAQSVLGVPVEPYTLRVTHIFRRENGEWKIAHRHADYVPIDQTLPGEAAPTAAGRQTHIEVDQGPGWESALGDLGGFLAEAHPRLAEGLQALHSGDPTPQLETWSMQDPVTLFGARVPLRSGWDEVSETFRWLAARWSNCTDQRLDLMAAGVSEGLAYLVGLEHIANSVLGVPVEPYTLRVTHIFRRENGEWKIAHRHADHVPIDQTRPDEGSAR